MRLFALATFAMIGACAVGDVTRNTEWRDVPDTTKVGTVLDLGSTAAITAEMAGTIATNTVDAKVAPWAMSGQPKPSGGGITTNDVNAIIASSNLCTVAAAQAMTNARLPATYADYHWTVPDDDIVFGGNMFCFGSHLYIGEAYGSVRVKSWTDLCAGDDIYTSQSLMGYVTDACSAAANSAKAYADATFLPLSGGSMTGPITMDYNYVELYVNGYGLHFTGTNDNYLAFAARVNADNDFIFVSRDADSEVSTWSFLTPDGSPVATSNMVERVIASKPAPSPLSGHTYDFANGSNFVKNVYTALTNVIQTLGGTVTNPPNFN